MTSIYGEIYQKIYPNSEIAKTLGYVLGKTKIRQPVIYDIGCGYGRAIPEYINKARAVFGVDIDKECLEVCRLRHPEVEFDQKINDKWLAPNLIFFNFHVLNYLRPNQFVNYLIDIAKKGVKDTWIYMDFIDRKKITNGCFEREKKIDQTFSFKNHLSAHHGSLATFSEEIYEGSALVFAKNSELYLWTIEEVVSMFHSSKLIVKNFDEIPSEKNITSSFCIEL